MQRLNPADKDIYARLSDNEFITSIKLYKSNINSDKLANALKVNNKLTSLDISGCRIGTKELINIVFGLMKNTTLTELNLYDNFYFNAGNIVLAQALQNDLNLKILNLSSTNINSITEKNFADALSQNTKLIILNLSDNSIDDKGAEKIANALKNNTTLLELNLSDNDISNEGAIHIANAFKENNTLRTLKFVADYPNKYVFDENTVKIFAEALERNQTLGTLNIANHKINNESVKYIIQIFETNTTLTKLNLSYGYEWTHKNSHIFKNNHINDVGANFLANALEKNQSLKKLNISGHCISNDGGNAILKALKNNKKLTSLNISQNNLILDMKSLEIIINTIRTNKTIKYLSLGYYYNKRNSKLYFRLLDALLQNDKIQEFDFCKPSLNLGRKAEEEYKFLISKKNEKLKHNRITIPFNLLIEKYLLLLNTPLIKDVCLMISFLMFNLFNEEKKDAITAKINLINSASSCIQYLLFSDNHNLGLRNKIYHVFQTIRKTDTCNKQLEFLNKQLASISYSNNSFFFKPLPMDPEMKTFLIAIKYNNIRTLNALREKKINNLHSDAEISFSLMKKIESFEFINEYIMLPGTDKKVSGTALKVYIEAIKLYNCKSASDRHNMLISIRTLLEDGVTANHPDLTSRRFHQELFDFVDFHINKAETKTNKRLRQSDSEAELPSQKHLRL